jgi:hypothetical protein
MQNFLSSLSLKPDSRRPKCLNARLLMEKSLKTPWSEHVEKMLWSPVTSKHLGWHACKGTPELADLELLLQLSRARLTSIMSR